MSGAVDYLSKEAGVGAGREMSSAGWSSPKAKSLSHTAEFRLSCLPSRFKSIETFRVFPSILPCFRGCLVSMGSFYRVRRMF